MPEPSTEIFIERRSFIRGRPWKPITDACWRRLCRGINCDGKGGSCGRAVFRTPPPDRAKLIVATPALQPREGREDPRGWFDEPRRRT